MEVFNSTTSISTQSFTFFSPKISFTTRKKKKTHLNFNKPNSKLPIFLPFSHHLPFSDIKRFRISAHFGRHTSRRRNSLRKKLTEQLQQQQQYQVFDNSPLIYDPNNDFQNQVLDFENEHFGSNLDSGSVEIEDIVDSGILKKSKSELYGDSVKLKQLESWVDQYKADSEFWGVGSGSIFTVFQNSDGKVERVDVDEDEILRRRGFGPRLLEESESEELAEVMSKISHAKNLAREVENGSQLWSKNSSVAKFVVLGGESNVVNAIRGLSVPPGLLPRLSKVGFAVLCGFFLFGVMKRWFVGDEDKMEYTRLEKEMLGRKMKARMENEILVKGSVEVIQPSKELELKTAERPYLDKQDLMDSILKAKVTTDSFGLQESSAAKDVNPTDLDDKILENIAMSRHARELEKKKQAGPGGGSGGDDDQVGNKLLNGKEMIQEHGERALSSSNDNEYFGSVNGFAKILNSTSSDDLGRHCTGIPEFALVESTDTEVPNSEINISDDSKAQNLKDRDEGPYLLDTDEGSQLSEATHTPFSEPAITSVKAKPRIIKSVKEAREYLSQKCDSQLQSEANLMEAVKEDSILGENVTNGETTRGLDTNEKPVDVSTSSGAQDIQNTPLASPDSKIKGNYSSPVKVTNPEAAEEMYEAVDCGIPTASLSHTCSDRNAERESSIMIPPSVRDSERQRSQKSEMNGRTLHTCSLDAKSNDTPVVTTSGDSNLNALASMMMENDDTESVEEGINHQKPVASSDLARSDRTADATPSLPKENWMEKNFHELEPVVKKMAVGFKDNYMVAREKVSQELNIDSKLPKFGEDGELEWMKDDRLREIVFQVRENELMGRDPFHLMDAEDKQAFFDGLEKKVDKVNEDLQNLHHWVHSNIENLDYGADGISLNDPPEKIIPRWKGPPVDNSPALLDDYMEQRKALATEIFGNQFIRNREENPLQKSVESSSTDNDATKSDVSTRNERQQVGNVKNPKIVIESSDGSVRAGKKSGKEYWEHTKKWSRGFLESYNAETDPEIKATMKDIGKDLDRWITEKEIQESADLMDKLPEKGRKIIQEKLNKVKREMEMFGPQAVVNKYSEYREEKEEDYLWWLDLSFVLCIELYTDQDGDQTIGYYTLEMAADLELDPKQYHVIAFEDAGDCKNLCYIIQSHLEMLGNGNAFVVAQPPKDAFREAKANGFSVTVIRKGELKLNVDQTLEEVEEQITEIGSKMYHDRIMKGRSVDISSLTKGVFGVMNPTKRKRPKRKLKKPRKQ